MAQALKVCYCLQIIYEEICVGAEECCVYVFVFLENPNIVQTFEGTRLIGCKCEEESTTIKYMWLHLDEPKRCECGFWYKAVPARKFWEEVGK